MNGPSYVQGGAKVITPLENAITFANGAKCQFGFDICEVLAKSIFCGLRYLQRFIAKDIQSRWRYLREMKDVFKELKVLVEKGKVALHKLTKIYWKRFNNVYNSTITNSTISVTIF